MARIRTHEQFIDRVKELVGNQYTVIGRYVISSEKLMMRHNSESCDYHEYPVSPNHFLKGRRCPKCFELRRNKDKLKSHEQYVKEVFEQVGYEYTVVSIYINERSPITLVHHKCGKSITLQAGSFLRGTRCKKCSLKEMGEKQRKTHEDFIKEVCELVGDEYTVIGTYQTNKSEIEIIHNICGETWFPTPNNFLRGSRCDNCFGKHLKTIDEFKREVFEIVGNEYTVLGEYDRALGNIEMIHNECGYVWSPRPNDFLSSEARCPVCSRLGDSKGAKRVRKFLESNNLDYKAEYRLENCRNILPLPFDFQITVNNKMVLIEYDGEQHFKNTFGDEKAFKETQFRDQIKNNYCKENNIQLIRIKYTQYEQIQQILEKELGIG
ncbi:putative nucleic-acid-binding Zn-ribbon protein [Neobacillus niacini]|uniref:hypothetical protein n=1 Tax=Neobacillus driksii TaxID=3035913 RepID=UPI002788B72F|nr:hypothetical protein [Neobacillus niacini]MDQ0972421.1 putative nucleic-acid-binding Zn-ribbon protein [Neobacillus niacini]